MIVKGIAVKQLLPSDITTVCIPAGILVAEGELAVEHDHEYVNGAVPPVRFTDALPSALPKQFAFCNEAIETIGPPTLDTPIATDCEHPFASETAT